MKRRSRAFVAGWVACLVSLTAAGPGARAEGPAAKDEVLQREDARIAAMIKPDPAALEELLADDLSYVHSSGVVDTKQEFVESVRSGRLKYKSFEREGLASRFYGDVAVLTGRANVMVLSSGAELDVRVRFTEVWVKRDGKWRMAAWHSTRVPAQ
jgi:hypothetical protein